MRTDAKLWYVVADRGHARIVASDAETGAWTVLHAYDSARLHARTHDLGSERPGHGHESVGSARHAVEGPDYHARDGAAFARTLAEEIAAGLARGDCDRLVLVAPARFLAALTEALPSDTHRHVAGTLAKDLTHVPLADLAGHFGAVVKPGGAS
jgi:protein required for attachment to host cells